MNEDWLKISIPMENVKFHAVHEIDEMKNDQKIDLADNFFNFKLDLFAGFLAVCFLCLLLKFLIVLHPKSLNRSQMSLSRLIRNFAIFSLSSSAKHRIASLRLLVLFFNQFLWLSALVVTSSISTDTVVVDTR